MATSKTTSLLSEWWRWWKTLAFVDALYKSRRNTSLRQASLIVTVAPALFMVIALIGPRLSSSR